MSTECHQVARRLDLMLFPSLDPVSPVVDSFERTSEQQFTSLTAKALNRCLIIQSLVGLSEPGL